MKKISWKLSPKTLTDEYYPDGLISGVYGKTVMPKSLG